MSFLFVFLLSTSAMAWNPFATEQLLEVPLSKAELQHVKVNAGWPKGDDHILIFEVSNGLKEPIQCGAANAELTTGQTVSKVFVPKFAIPAALTRNASMPVSKGTPISGTPIICGGLKTPRFVLRSSQSPWC